MREDENEKKGEAHSSLPSHYNSRLPCLLPLTRIHRKDLPSQSVPLSSLLVLHSFAYVLPVDRDESSDGARASDDPVRRSSNEVRVVRGEGEVVEPEVFVRDGRESVLVGGDGESAGHG